MQLHLCGVLITAIGVSYLLENIALLIYGADIKSFTSVINWEGVSFAGGQLKIQGVTIVTILVSVVILIVLQLFINKTKQGQAMLAASEDKAAAALMGIDVNKTIALTFAIGSALAAVAGALLCSAYPSLSPYTGAMPGIKAFVAAVLWRYRLNSGRHDRRTCSGNSRDPVKDLYFITAFGCHCFRHSGNRSFG